MRTIVISDIHGYVRTLETLLSHIAYNPDGDRLLLLGDYVDGGPASLGVIRLLQQLVEYSNVQVIGGNHDDMFLNWLGDNDYRLLPYTNTKNGGLQTIQSFCPWYKSASDDQDARDYINGNYKSEINFLQNLPYYIEDDHHIYVHAGIDPIQEDWKKTSHKDFRWIRGRFYRHDGQFSTDKTIVFGHEVCARLHEDEHNFTPWFGKQLISIDGGIKFGKYLNALIIEEKSEYRFTSIPSCD